MKLHFAVAAAILQRMKRDMDLIRALLQALAESRSQYSAPKIPGATELEVANHLNLLRDAALVEFHSDSVGGPGKLRITWAGHDFLENSGPESRWEAAKKRLELAGGAGFEVLKAVLAELASRAVGLS